MDESDNQNYSLWDIAVLCLLRERPMHPYEMQKLLQERHKDEVLVLKRGSLYHAINRLLRSEHIAVVETGRDGRRPERTTYAITATGRQAHRRWLEEMIAQPRREPSAFMACVSFLVYLTPEDALKQLDARARRLEAEERTLQGQITALESRLPRIHLVETEYLLAMCQAELGWVRTIVGDLRNGRFTWDLEQILADIHGNSEENEREK